MESKHKSSPNLHIVFTLINFVLVAVSVLALSYSLQLHRRDITTIQQDVKVLQEQLLHVQYQYGNISEIHSRQRRQTWWQRRQQERRRQQELAKKRQQALAKKRQQELAKKRQQELARRRQQELAKKRQQELAKKRQQELAKKRQQELAKKRQQELAKKRQQELAKKRQEFLRKQQELKRQQELKKKGKQPTPTPFKAKEPPRVKPVNATAKPKNESTILTVLIKAEEFWKAISKQPLTTTCKKVIKEKKYIVCVKADGKNITIDPLGRKIINGTVDLGAVRYDKGSAKLIAARRLVSRETQKYVKAYFNNLFGSKAATHKEFNEILLTKIQDAITARLQKGIVTISNTTTTTTGTGVTGPPGPPGTSITRAQIIAIAGAPGARGFRGTRGFRGPRGRLGPQGRPGLAAIVGADGRVQWMSENKARTMLFKRHGAPRSAGVIAVKGAPVGPIVMSGPRAAATTKVTQKSPFANFVAPNITSKPNASVTVAAGTRVSLSTTVRGFPIPDSFWVNDATGQAIFGNSMTIKNATIEDSGKWTFKAKNAMGIASTKVDLLVATKPHYTKGRLSDKIAYEKKTTMIQCHVDAHPKPKIEWGRHGNIKLDPAHHKVINGDLYIKNPTIKEQGLYICRAKNVMGLILAGTKVFVQKFVPYRAQKLMPSKIAVKDYTTPLQLTCTATGNPPPTVRWYKDGKMLESKNYAKDPQKKGELPLIVSQLELKQVSSKDEGTYSCTMNSTMMPTPVEYKTTISLYKCKDLYAPHNGVMVGNDRNVGACVKFACNPGCMLYGSQIRVCNKNGKWTGTPPVCYDVGEVAFECHHYNILTEGDRHINSHMIMGNCDRNLAEGWYRIGGDAGRMMPSSCQRGGQCNSKLPGWLYGQHPLKEDGCIKTHVCFGDSRSNCCQHKQPVLVRNCGTFYVYKLAPTKSCTMRYCTMG